MAQYLKENDDEQITISHLMLKMGDFCGKDTNIYGAKHVKRKLTEHFGDIIVITNNGTADLVIFRSTASNFLNSFYEAPKLRDSKAEKMRIVKVGADLIKHDIKCKQTSKDTYSTPMDISSLEKNSTFVPETLAYF